MTTTTLRLRAVGMCATVIIWIGVGPAAARQPSQEPTGNRRAGPAASAPAPPPQVNTYKDHFSGHIERTAGESVPAWREPVRAKPGSPNVLIVVLDDVGFGQIGAFGGLIDTPELDRLADSGLRYNNMHTTALCSPTRSCILTGRNHHRNHMACIIEGSTGFPGYDGRIPFSNGFLSEILAANGYATLAVGKWHLTPVEDLSMAAPRDRWPLGRGFQRFYGFMGGETHQFYPELVYDNHRISPPATPEEGYHLGKDITDTAIEFIQDVKAVTPDMPFFLYYAPGAMHAPHHVAQDWIAKYAGRFDMGWDRARELILERQKRMGVVPPDTALAPRNQEVRAWKNLSEQEQQLYSSMMEIFAGFMEFTDHQIGRLIRYLDDIGELDNTLIMVISDNGASAEGERNGLFSEGSFFNAVPETVDFIWGHRDQLGGPESFNHYPFGWTMAGNTPFKRWKREVHLGGIRDPFIVHWPRGFSARGEVRAQYAHCIDLMPTVLDVLGIDPPAEIHGVAQSRIDGASFAQTFDKPDAPSTRRTQYFEMFGYRAIYHDGWTAVSPHLPFGTEMTEEVLAHTTWELYHTDVDFSQVDDLAEKYPEKVAMMNELWWAEAGRNNVLPLDGRGLERFRVPRPTLARPRTRYQYYPGAAPVRANEALPTINSSYRITADVVVPEGGAEGVILAHGGNLGGWTLYLEDGRLRWTYNWLGRELYDLASEIPVPEGNVSLGFTFAKTDGERGGGGVGTLSINGSVVATGTIPHTVPRTYWPSGEGLTCGYDELTPVSDVYEAPFEFTGTIRKVVGEAF
jgi:arylsulfatase